VTVSHTAVPASRSAAITSGAGHPKVNDTTATGSASSRSTLASKASSSLRGTPTATPAASAHGASRSA
jgi:hypothetical protein